MQIASNGPAGPMLLDVVAWEPTIIKPLSIISIKPAELHTYWPFIQRGLLAIRRKVESDALPEDIYGAIRAEAAYVFIVSRETRWLGFAVWHKQERPWSHKLDMFVWGVWTIPLRERLPGDNVTEAFQYGRAHLHEIKRSLAANRIIGISSRKGLCKRYGFKELSFTCEI